MIGRSLHLRRHVLWGAAGCLADGARHLVLGVPKVADLHHRPLPPSVQQNVVQLQAGEDA